MCETRPSLEGVEGACQAAFPSIRGGDGVRGGGIVCGSQRDRTQPLPLRGRSLEWPGQLGERPAPGPAVDVIAREEHLHFVPEGACLARAAVVGGRLANEVDAASRARARRVEEVAVSRDLIRSRETRAR